MRTAFLFSLALACCTIAFAQTERPPLHEQPNIQVSGYAEKEITPDEIYIAIKLEEKMESRTKVTIETLEAELKSNLTSAGIDLANLSITDMLSYYQRSIFRKDILAYRKYELKVADATEARKVFEQLDAMEIDEAYITRLSHSRLEEFKKEVKIAAVKDAKAKADYLLEAIGEKTGKPIEIVESATANIPAVGSQDEFQLTEKMYLGAVETSGGLSKSLDFKKIKLTSTIRAKFGIQ